jgi:hypothetical protein
MHAAAATAGCSYWLLYSSRQQQQQQRSSQQQQQQQQQSRHAAWYSSTGWDHVRLSWRSLDLILYWKILCSNFLQYKVPAPGSRSGRGYFSRFFAFGVFKHVNPNWVDMLRGGLPRMFEKFYN